MRMYRYPAVTVVLCFLSISQGARAEPAGSVVYVHGDTRIIDAAGNGRPVQRGEQVLAGQTLLTGNGRMQVQFADGGFIAVQPNTRFKVDEYHYAGSEDGTERSFFNLVKGGIRFITGTIGHKNNQNYRIRTAVATIGIRGSAGRANLCVSGSCAGRPDGLYVTGNQDTLTLRNQTGEVDINAGQTYHVQCETCGIRQVDQPPEAFAAVEQDGDESENEEESGSEEGVTDEQTTDEQALDEAVAFDESSTAEFAAGDERNADGSLEAIDASTGSVQGNRAIGLGYNKHVPVGASVGHSSGVAAFPFDGAGGNQVTFDAGGVPVSGTGANTSGSSPGSTFSFDTSGATLQEQGSNATLAVAWARWSGGWTASVDGVPVDPAGDMHAIYATADRIVNVPASGTATYSTLAGGTSPTIVSNFGGPYVGTLTSMTVTVNFDTSQVSGALAGSFNDPSFGLASFSASGSGALNSMLGDGGTFSLNGACTGGICSYFGVSSLFGGSEFGLVGPNAEGAAGVYDLKGANNDIGITGTYLLTQ